MVKRALLAVMVLTASCQDQPVPMDPARLLTRISLDLRGIRPSEAEIAAVEADPTLVDVFAEDYLQDPRFSEQVMHLFADHYRTRIDDFPTNADSYNLPDEVAFATSVGEAPLRMLAFITENDLPYGEIATADWTMADEILGSAWPTDYPAGEIGWKQVTYTDGRPAAGILSTNSFWWRYGSTFDNANRGRANAISRVLLCQDYLAQPIEFERNINLLDREAVENAIKTNPGCVACHNSLEPLAAGLWGFFYERVDSPLDTSFYHPERELFWTFGSQASPAYYGEPVTDMSDLGRKISQDPRLAECVTQQVFEGLIRRKATLEDASSLFEHREAFVDNGSTIRSLFRSVLKTPEYRMDGTSDPIFATGKMISVDQLSSVLFDLTGFRFTRDGADILRLTNRGLRTLGGGADGLSVISAAVEPTVTVALVVERLAEAASHFVVEADFANPAEARLFTEIDFSETPTTNRAAMVAQLQRLHLLLFGKRVSADGFEVVSDLALWDKLFALQEDPKEAWAGVLTALFRSPEFLFY